MEFAASSNQDHACPVAKALIGVRQTDIPGRRLDQFGRRRNRFAVSADASTAPAYGNPAPGSVRFRSPWRASSPFERHPGTILRFPVACRRRSRHAAGFDFDALFDRSADASLRILRRFVPCAHSLPPWFIALRMTRESRAAINMGGGKLWARPIPRRAMPPLPVRERDANTSVAHVGRKGIDSPLRSRIRRTDPRSSSTRSHASRGAGSCEPFRSRCEAVPRRKSRDPESAISPPFRRKIPVPPLPQVRRPRP